MTDDFEIIFDTVRIRLARWSICAGMPRVPFVIGGMSNGDERTVQYEGITDEPTGADLERLKQLYFVRFPDGRDRQRWPGLTYLRVRPRWLRFSDFNQSSPAIVEFTF